MIQCAEFIFFVWIFASFLINFKLSLRTPGNMVLGIVDIILGIIQFIIWWKFFRGEYDGLGGFSHSILFGTCMTIFIGGVNIAAYFRNKKETSNKTREDD